MNLLLLPMCLNFCQVVSTIGIGKPIEEDECIE